MKKLAVLGASGHGKVVADTAESCGWTEIVFFDDAWPSRVVNGSWPVVGTSDDLLAQIQNFDGVIVAMLESFRALSSSFDVSSFRETSWSMKKRR